MNSYLSIIPISAKVHRRQNRMTTLCITIAVFLISAVFSMADMAVRQESARLIEKHGTDVIRDLLTNQTVLSLFPIAAALFVFVLLAGIIMISGSLNSSVAQKTQFFGMLRCIGMSKMQVIKYVRLEALSWCKTAVPAGLILGTAASWILCAVLRFGIGGEWASMPQLRISLIGLISGTLAGVLTVLIAAGKPARNAAKVSPVSAVSGNSAEAGEIRAVNTKIMKIENALGFSHAVQSKKKLFLLISSFALSIILFLSFSVFIDLVNCLMPQYASAAEIEIWSNDGSNSVDGNLVSLLNGTDGIKQAFGRRSKFGVAAECDADSGIKAVDIISFDRFDLDCLPKDGLLNKGSELEKVYGDSSFALIISDEDVEKGAKLTISGETLELAGSLKYDPFSDSGSTEGRTSLIVSDETYKRLFGESDYALVLVQLSKTADDGTVKQISAMLDDNCELHDGRDDSNSGTYAAFLVCTYSFLAIIAAVAVLNIANSISVSVSARIKQYGAMRAVGMSEKQLEKMIVSEALTYAVSGCAVGIIVGLLISRWLYGFLVTSHFSYATWHLPVADLAVIVLFFALSVIAGVYAPVKRLRNMSITETINEL